MIHLYGQGFIRKDFGSYANDLRGSEPELARMVWVLQAQQSKCLWERRRLRARPTAQHESETKRKGADAEAIISAGRMPTSPQWACTYTLKQAHAMACRSS